MSDETSTGDEPEYYKRFKDSLNKAQEDSRVISRGRAKVGLQLVQTYKGYDIIRVSASGWLWVRQPNGEIYKSRKTGKIAAFRSKGGAVALICNLIRHAKEK